MSSDPPGVPPAVRLLQLATGGWVSATVGAAAELGVADLLAGRARTAGDLADELRADPDALHRLLRACAGLELVREREDGHFELTELGDGLREDSPGSMRNFVRWTYLPEERLSWAQLPEAVRTGTPVFETVHGTPVWEHLRARPEVADVFDRAMTEASSQLVRPVVEAADFSGDSVVVDVAGGRGALLSAVLDANPQVRGILYDQPAVVAESELPRRHPGRCETVAGDFFDSVPAGGDAYVLSNILHDWDDDDALRILTNCAEAMRGHGRVLLIEALHPLPPATSPTVGLMDLDMLVLCGGRQRTEAEFGELFRKAGLRPSRVVPIGLHSVLDAVPA